MNVLVRYLKRMNDIFILLSECGYDYTNSTSIGMFSFALTNLLMTTDLPTTISSFAIANTSLRLNPKKKAKSKKGDQIMEYE